jgi:Domain of unknown function (DUF4377)/Kazal-type serine protease inhibitor domain/S-layer homology domain
MQYDPVCGTDGVTYGNACTAATENKTIAYAGECKTGTELEQALKFAYQFGITKYTNLTDFKSESAVTREQISKMMLQFAKAMSRTSNKGTFSCAFTDMNLTDPTLTNYITDACTQGMIKWWDGKFHPQNSVTHAQAITILMRVMNGTLDEPDQRWTPYEQYAITKWYIKQALGQPMWIITRWELIVLMNTIYTKSTQSNTLYETWTISDSLVPCTWVAPQQCMQITRNGKAELFYDQIQWFDYVPWYTYNLQVVGRKIDNPPADASNMARSLVSLTSHTSTSGKPDVLPQPWCDWTKIDNSKLTIWWQTCDITRNFTTVSYDSKLPGVLISSKQDQITTQIPLIHIFRSITSTGSTWWIQKLLFDTHNTMIKQWIVNKSQDCIFKQQTTQVGSNYERYDFIPNATWANCGPYGWSTSASNYFIKTKADITTMIYLNTNEPHRTYIDWSSAVIK